MIWVGGASHGNHNEYKPNITPGMWNPGIYHIYVVYKITLHTGTITTATSYPHGSCDVEDTINYDLIIANVKVINSIDRA